MISDQRKLNHYDKTTGFAGGSSSYAEASTSVETLADRPEDRWLKVFQSVVCVKV
jgi:hypothetical protein